MFWSYYDHTNLTALSRRVSFCESARSMALVARSHASMGKMPVGPTAKMAVLHPVFEQLAGFSYPCSPDFHHLLIITLIKTAVITIIQVTT